jgi:hypothetical protein
MAMAIRHLSPTMVLREISTNHGDGFVIAYGTCYNKAGMTLHHPSFLIYESHLLY